MNLDPPTLRTYLYTVYDYTVMHVLYLRNVMHMYLLYFVRLSHKSYQLQASCPVTPLPFQGNGVAIPGMAGRIAGVVRITGADGSLIGTTTKVQGD